MSSEFIAHFEDYLKKKHIIKEKVIPYYVNHLYRFRDFVKELKGRTKEERIILFSESLVDDVSLEDWQRKQALDAVQLYIYTFLPSLDRDDQQTATINDSFQQLTDRMYRSLLLRRRAKATAEAYMMWLRRFLTYANKTHQNHTENDTVKNFLASLALEEEVAASTQDQAFSGLLFFFRNVLEKDLTDMASNIRAKQSQKLPVVFTLTEVKEILELATGKEKLMLSVIYGGGLRVNELTRLRVQDIDFEQNLLVIRDAKGNKDRMTLLSEKVAPVLKAHLQEMKKLHDADLEAGFGEVSLPGALIRKYPKAGKAWGWQWAFPSTKFSVDPKSGRQMRYHVRAARIRKHLKKVMDELEIYKHASVHTLRHSFATHLMLQGVDIRTVQELMGHKSVETTMIYTRLVKQLSPKPKSPLDKL